MTDNLPKKPQIFITDLNDCGGDEKSIHMSVSVRNLSRLKELRIENLWLIGANDKELRKILPLVKLKYLNLYQVLAKDLTILEALDQTETIILNWNTKATTLWDISKNTNLKTLEITDFSKLEEIDQLSLATQIESLALGGGYGKSMKIKTINPLKYLTNLKCLSLTNLKIEDDTLQPLGQLKNLFKLIISNQFEIKEYAWLATRLINTECKMFQATNTCNIVGADSKTVWDTMVTGRRKPVLLSNKDQVKIDKIIKDFEKLKNELAE
jgi:hypothetical protein